MSTKTVTLNSGYEIPVLGYGTWQAAPGEVGKATEAALKAGYKHLDLAKVYGNQPEIRAPIKNAGVDRSELFITSKLWNSSHAPENVEPALDDTLQELGLDYLDLYLIHWPVSFEPSSADPKGVKELFPLTGEKNASGTPTVKLDNKTSIVDTWKAMIALLKTKKVRSIGVSNFSTSMIDLLIKETGVTPAVHQIERHPRLPQLDLVAHHAKHNIHITAYSPLGNNGEGLPLLVEDETVKSVASKLGDGVTPAQVLIAWGLEGGHSVIPKSVTPARIASNLASADVTVPAGALQKLAEGGEGKRFNIPFNYKPQWDINIFGTPAESGASGKVVLGA